MKTGSLYRLNRYHYFFPSKEVIRACYRFDSDSEFEVFIENQKKLLGDLEMAIGQKKRIKIALKVYKDINKKYFLKILVNYDEYSLLKREIFILNLLFSLKWKLNLF